MPILALGWLALGREVQAPRPDYLAAGAVTIVTANLLIHALSAPHGEEK